MEPCQAYCRLKTITFTSGKVEFTRVSNRQDDAAATSRLDEITTYFKTGAGIYTKLKSIKFTHTYFYSSDVYAQNSGVPNENCDRYRLRLDGLKFKDGLGNENSGYTFSYNSTNLPPKTSYAQDFWGYYNGASSNTTLVPTATVYNDLHQPVVIGGANKTPNEFYMKAGTLEKITYPTGGYTVFDTESHKTLVQNSIVSESHQAHAQGQFANQIVVKTFTTPLVVNSGSGKLNITIAPYGANDPQPFVKIKNMSTAQEQTIISTDRTQWFSTSVNYSFGSQITYEITASCYVNQPNAMAAITALFTKTIDDPHMETVGGLRIKSIKHYKFDNTLAGEENYKYGPNENGGGVFVGVSGNANSYLRNQKIYFAASLSCSIFMGGSYTVFMGGALFDQSLVHGSPVVYTNVVKYHGTTSANVGKTVYDYGTELQQLAVTQPLPSGQHLANNQGIIIINDSWKKGHLRIQQEHRKNADNSYTLMQETEKIYNVIYDSTTYGLFAQLKFDRVIVGVGGDFCLQKLFEDYAWAEYPINTGYVQLAQTINKDYNSDGSAFAQNTVTFSYDAVRKDIETKSVVINSKNEAIESEKRYPFHKSQLSAPITPNESIALDDMVAKNIIVPIEEIQRRNNTQVLLKKTSYEYVDGVIIAPTNVKYQSKSTPIETRLLFTKYDSYGNLIEQSKTNDVKQSYIWDYASSYPVAQAINAPADEIAATSFEAENNGNWNYTGAITPVTSAPFPPTGFKYYTLAGGSTAITTTMIPAKKYLLSYWRYNNSTTPLTIAGGTNSVKIGRTYNNWTYFEHSLTASLSLLTISGNGAVDELRLCPADCQMTTYTYFPLVGIRTVCDLNNRITYYEYDNFNRLMHIKDQDGNIIKKFCYNYAGQTINCN